MAHVTNDMGDIVAYDLADSVMELLTSKVGIGLFLAVDIAGGGEFLGALGDLAGEAGELAQGF